MSSSGRARSHGTIPDIHRYTCTAAVSPVSFIQPRDLIAFYPILSSLSPPPLFSLASLHERQTLWHFSSWTTMRSIFQTSSLELYSIETKPDRGVRETGPDQAKLERPIFRGISGKRKNLRYVKQRIRRTRSIFQIHCRKRVTVSITRATQPSLDARRSTRD